MKKLNDLLLGCSLLALGACGGSGGDADVNQAPTARFEVAGSTQAGEVIAFDGATSTDPEGSPLTFSWDFGDGSAGGTAQIAHIYAQAGTYTARVRVLDEQGLVGEFTRSITVGAAPTAERTTTVAARVTGTDGLPLDGVTITVQGASGPASSATTDVDGRATLSLGVGVNVVLRLAKPGYTDQIRQLRLPATVGSDGRFDASLMPRSSTQTLANAAVGGTLTGTDGVRLTLPAGALVDALTGADVAGPVQVTMTPVDVNTAALAAFPGQFEGVIGDGTRSPIVSYGTTEFLLTQNGRALQIKPGARATIDLPLYASGHLNGTSLAAGASLPLWSLDERSALWIQEGNGTVVAAAGSPTGLALRAEVGHFSWWNADLGYQPYRPRPRCINDVPGQYDSIFEQATICKMLAEMDKPIPAQGAAEQAARALSRAAAAAAVAAPQPRAFPAVRIDGTTPIAGGVALDVPPDTDIVLTGTALNGTWRGQVKVRGQQGASADVIVPLRPVAAGSTSQQITLPFDEVRAAAPYRTDSYLFTGAAGQGVDIRIGAESSTLTGRVRLRNAAGTLLNAAGFGPDSARLLVTLPSAGEYRIEVEPALGAPGAYRLQATAASVQEQPASTEGADLRAPLVVAHGGGLMAIWMARDSASNPQWMGMSSSAAGQSWSAPWRLTPAQGFDDASGLAVQAMADGTGSAWVMWYDSVTRGPMVARGAMGVGSAWAEPTALASDTCRGNRVQRLAVNGAGQAIVMWQRTSATAGANAGWCSRRFENGGWGAEELIGAAPGHNFASTALQLALTNAGVAAAAWNMNGTSVPVVALQGGAGQAWSAPVVLDATANDPLAPGARWSALAAGADGTLVLTWRSKDAYFDRPGVSAVYAAVKAPGQPWSLRRLLGDSSSTSFGYPQAGWLGEGRFAVAWNDNGAGPRLREYTAGSGWGDLQALAVAAESPSSTNLWNLATAGDGSAIVVSQGYLPSASGIHLFVDMRNPATGTWHAPATQAANALVTGGYGPPVAVDAGWGGFVWMQTHDLGYQVRALRLSATPP